MSDRRFPPSGTCLPTPADPPQGAGSARLHDSGSATATLIALARLLAKQAAADLLRAEGFPSPEPDKES